ncbi:PDZ domain-containing protein, partial [bacterium]|nr:PDZ domain-containing protein [candidate division CSSED10-310 bacterium]
TVGVVSAKSRSAVMPYSELPYQDFIQTDASINPGNSGGPLLNISGELVGINSVIATRTGQSAGIGFAIPINLIQPFIAQLKEKGSVTRGWLGVTIQPVDDNLAKALDLKSNSGALITEIVEDSPADKAGLEIKDVITQFNRNEIKDSNELSRIVASTEVGEKVDVTVIRDGREKQLKVEIGERPANIWTETSTRSNRIKDLGMTVETITPDIAAQLKLEKPEGVVITNIEPGGAADNGGLIVGDVILELNDKKIDSLAAYRSAIEELKPGEAASLYILRGGRKIFRAIKIPEA